MVRALIAMVLLLALPGAARAEQIHVLCSNGIRTAIEDIVPEFEKATGHTVTVTFGLAARLARDIDSGTPFDVAILTPPLIDAGLTRGTLARGSEVTIGRSPLAIFARRGTAKPDIATTDALTRVLLAASSIAYTREGASGIYFAGLVERLGLTERMRAKTRLAGGADEVGKLVASGDAALGVLPVSEILPVSGVEIVAPLPPEVQSYVVMVAALKAGPNQLAAARAFIEYLNAPSSRVLLRHRGMEPTR